MLHTETNSVNGGTYNWPGANDKEDDSDTSFSVPGFPMRFSAMSSGAYTFKYFTLFNSAFLFVTYISYL